MSNSGYEQPKFNQRNINAPSPVKIDLTVPLPLIDSAGVKGLEGSAPSEFIRSAQQVVFLPCFRPTDYAFHGENLNSNYPEKGKPTIRTALVIGNNFNASIFVNYNQRDLKGLGTQLYLRVEDEESHNFNAFVPGASPPLVRWMIDEVLIPVRDELMLTNPSPDSEY